MFPLHDGGGDGALEMLVVSLQQSHLAVSAFKLYVPGSKYAIRVETSPISISI